MNPPTTIRAISGHHRPPYRANKWPPSLRVRGVAREVRRPGGPERWFAWPRSQDIPDPVDRQGEVIPRLLFGLGFGLFGQFLDRAFPVGDKLFTLLLGNRRIRASGSCPSVLSLGFGGHNSLLLAESASTGSSLVDCTMNLSCPNARGAGGEKVRHGRVANGACDRSSLREFVRWAPRGRIERSTHSRIRKTHRRQKPPLGLNR